MLNARLPKNLLFGQLNVMYASVEVPTGSLGLLSMMLCLHECQS